jgi:glycosyltransferase involved in cell wall biosynthesis
MKRPVCYDITRLLTRIANATPNGIDRVDHALAQHFLAGDDGSRFGASATGFGSRLLAGPAAAEAVDSIAAHWGEASRGGGENAADGVPGDAVYETVVDWLAGANATRVAAVKRRKRQLPVDIGGMVGWAHRHGIPFKSPSTALPPRSAYINASQFPLWIASSFEWLERRRDISALFFIHDLLPVLMPEYFREAEFERHRRRLRNFARFGSAAIVTTKTVAADLTAHLATLGRHDVPIFQAPTPIAATFSTPRALDARLSQIPYFVFCSTIEPRKNHLMILWVWRELVGRLGKAAPKLVLVGTRGWHYDAIIDLIERSPALRDTVIEVGGLSTPGLKRLMDNARAVLMPTFGEGYGLPVHEALAAGAPVIAADVPVFREIVSDRLTLISPLDGEAWLEAIAALSIADRPFQSDPPRPEGWARYFEGLETFIDAL